jgi:hypothetical protein
MGKPAATQLASLLIAAAVLIFAALPNANGANEGTCPPDRPSGTPPNCCAEGTTFREGFCYPTNCPPGYFGTPPHCQRTCGPDKVVVGQACYDPCPAGTTGTPPNCFCPAGQEWDGKASACKERPKCTGGMVGTPPNCKCPGELVEAGGSCVPCAGGMIKSKGKCVCESGERYDEAAGKCVTCPGNRFTKSKSCLRYVQCTWRGTAPACDGSCPPGWKGHTRSDDGKGNFAPKFPGMDPTEFFSMDEFGESCWTGTKMLCCRGYNR